MLPPHVDVHAIRALEFHPTFPLIAKLAALYQEGGIALETHVQPVGRSLPINATTNKDVLFHMTRNTPPQITGSLIAGYQQGHTLHDLLTYCCNVLRQDIRVPQGQDTGMYSRIVTEARASGRVDEAIETLVTHIGRNATSPLELTLGQQALKQLLQLKNPPSPLKNGRELLNNWLTQRDEANPSSHFFRQRLEDMNNEREWVEEGYRDEHNDWVVAYKKLPRYQSYWDNNQVIIHERGERISIPPEPDYQGPMFESRIGHMPFPPEPEIPTFDPFTEESLLEKVYNSYSFEHVFGLLDRPLELTDYPTE